MNPEMNFLAERVKTKTSRRPEPPGLVRRLFLHQDLEFWVRLVNPLWSFWEARARVRAIIRETPTTKTFVLQPNRHWRGFEPGQFVPVFVEIDGVRERRCYSITDAPQGGRWLAITVGRVEGGRVSSWLHEYVRVGDVLPIGAAAGEYVLGPGEREGGRPLFISGGTGITPNFAMIRALAKGRRLDGVAVLHFARTEADVIFGAKLRELAREFPGMRLRIRTTRAGGGAGGGAAAGRLSEELLREFVPDWTERPAYLCGPERMMAAAREIWAACGVEHRLRTESFGSPRTLVGKNHAGISGARIVAVDTGVEFRSAGRGTLLEQAEQAGLRPAFGCRIGICHTCKCRKVRGSVANLRTGEISVAEEEDIQLCVSAPCSDVELRL